MALRERNSALHWAATRPEDNTPAVAVAVGHFVQVGVPPGTPFPHDSSRDTPATAVASQEAQPRGRVVARPDLWLVQQVGFKGSPRHAFVWAGRHTGPSKSRAITFRRRNSGSSLPSK